MFHCVNKIDIKISLTFIYTVQEAINHVTKEGGNERKELANSTSECTKHEIQKMTYKKVGQLVHPKTISSKFWVGLS